MPRAVLTDLQRVVYAEVVAAPRSTPDLALRAGVPLRRTREALSALRKKGRVDMRPGKPQRWTRIATRGEHTTPIRLTDGEVSVLLERDCTSCGRAYGDHARGCILDEDEASTAERKLTEASSWFRGVSGPMTAEGRVVGIRDAA